MGNLSGIAWSIAYRLRGPFRQHDSADADKVVTEIGATIQDADAAIRS